MKIKTVTLENFKVLKKVKLDLAHLTLLSGVNSCGKSSFIQALLLMKQNESLIDWHLKTGSKEEFVVEFNGQYVQLVNAANILNQDADYRYNIDIGVENEQGCIIESTLSYEKEKDEYRVLKCRSEMSGDSRDISKHSNLFNSLQYLCTHRVPPAITYPLSKDYDFEDIGNSGEYAAYYLARKGTDNIHIDHLRHSQSQSNQLKENVSCYLSDISEGVSINVQMHREVNAAQLHYTDHIIGRDSNPLNVGFGLSYVLPIIIALLKAKSDDLLIIENPETHLHPSAQVQIGELIAKASANGVQIIVETHSDHILNAIRVATKNRILQPTHSQIYFFSKDKEECKTVAQKLNIDENGKINDCPINFFDEWDNQLDKLLW